MRSTHEYSWSRAIALVLGFLTVAVLMVFVARSARPAEIIPGIGVSRDIEGATKAQVYGSLAVRGDLMPALKTEIGVGYRSESRFDNQLKVKTWPITASLWLQPVPALYAGAGVGWYQTTNDYNQHVVTVQDNTESKFGVHVGGGLRVPIAPAAAIDLGGRYVMMRKQESPLIPQKFNPDFWSSTLGLAIGF